MSRDAEKNGIYDFRPDAVVKVLTLGDSGVGKTSFVVQYVDEVFTDKFIPTIGMDLKEKNIVYHELNDDGTRSTQASQKINLQLWDTAGQERFRSLTTAFYRDAMGFILMFDLTHEATFVNVRSWLSQLQTHATSQEPPMVLVGNKCDLDNRAVPESEVYSLADHIGIPYFETSAKSGHNVNNAVEALIDQIVAQMDCISELSHCTIDKRKRLNDIKEVDENTNNCSC